MNPNIFLLIVSFDPLHIGCTIFKPNSNGPVVNLCFLGNFKARKAFQTIRGTILEEIAFHSRLKEAAAQGLQIVDRIQNIVSSADHILAANQASYLSMVLQSKKRCTDALQVASSSLQNIQVEFEKKCASSSAAIDLTESDVPKLELLPLE